MEDMKLTQLAEFFHSGINGSCDFSSFRRVELNVQLTRGQVAF